MILELRVVDNSFDSFDNSGIGNWEIGDWETDNFGIGSLVFGVWWKLDRCHVLYRIGDRCLADEVDAADAADIDFDIGFDIDKTGEEWV